MTRQVPFPSPYERPLLLVWPDAGHWLGMGRTTAYRHAKAGSFPVEVLHVGGRLFVRNVDLRRFLGLEP